MRPAPLPSFIASTITLNLMLVLAGCGRVETSPTAPAAPAVARKTAPLREQEVASDMLVESAVQLLQASKRSPTAHRIAADRLNQYLAKSRSTGVSPVSPLSADIRTSLAGRLTPHQLQLIEGEQFDRPDSIHVENCFLLRDAVKQATVGKQDAMSKALAIFDWVVRNVQIIPLEESAPVPLTPRMTLLVGRGNEAERAWTFMELLRQAEIESVLLAYLDKSPDGKQTWLVPWLPAALWDDSLHLFDTTLGLPVPGPEDQPVATLQQVLADPSLLAQLSPDVQHPYRLKPEHLRSVLMLLESTPTYWAPRMHFLQDSLPTEQHAVLWSDLIGLANRIRNATSDETPQDLWAVPKAVHELLFTREYTDTILGNRENPIGLLSAYQYFSSEEARTAHLQGNPKQAILLYLANRVPFDQWMASQRNQLGIQAVVLNAAGAEAPREVVQDVYMKFMSHVQGLYESIREDSTYFLGTLKFQEQDYKASTNWMAKSYLEKYPEGRWASGARFHLGRCAEAQSNIEKAIEYFTTRDSSPQAAGNLVRARRLGWKGHLISADDGTVPPTDQPNN
jgi:hypothetical protein